MRLLNLLVFYMLQGLAGGQILLGPLVGLVGRSSSIEVALVVSSLVLIPVCVVYLWAALGSSTVAS